MPHLDRDALVAHVVTEHPAAARVFQKHGIDYCCHGEVSLAEACRVAGLDLDALVQELRAAIPANEVAAEDPRALTTLALVARIVDRHHGYLRRALPAIAPVAAKVARVHGAHDPRLVELEAVFRELAGSLAPHLDDEEAVLFPALLAPAPGGADVARELARMRDEHLAVGDLLARMRRLTDGYATPAWGCNTYRVLMGELEALEGDVLRHVHLENHVLAPRFEAADAAERCAGTAS